MRDLPQRLQIEENTGSPLEAAAVFQQSREAQDYCVNKGSSSTDAIQSCDFSSIAALASARRQEKAHRMRDQEPLLLHICLTRMPGGRCVGAPRAQARAAQQQEQRGLDRGLCTSHVNQMVHESALD